MSDADGVLLMKDVEVCVLHPALEGHEDRNVAFLMDGATVRVTDGVAMALALAMVQSMRFGGSMRVDEESDISVCDRPDDDTWTIRIGGRRIWLSRKDAYLMADAVMHAVFKAREMKA